MSLKKQQFSLEQNILRFITSVGPSKVGFLTLTFEDNVVDPKEAYRRFDSLRKHFLRKFFGEYILVKERQGRGAWHYHLLIDCRADILGHGTWQKVPGIGWRFRNPPVELQKLRALLRERLPLYRFGRHELQPIRTTGDQVAKYIGKYLGKSALNRRKDDKGVRLVQYSRGVDRAVYGTTRFGWVGEFHAKLRKAVRYHLLTVHSLHGMDATYHHLGPKWAFHIYGEVLAKIECQAALLFNASVAALPPIVADGFLLHPVTGEILF